MKKTILTLLTCISIPSFADVPNTFNAGDVATAESFNQNFQSLSSSIQNLEAEAADIKTQIENLESSSNGSGDGGSANSDFVTANVNGTPMKVRSSILGSYVITTPTGLTVQVDAEGLTRNYLYYKSNDCSGQPYVSTVSMTQHLDKGVSHVFRNPRLSTTNLYLENIQGALYYSIDENLVKLNHGSVKNPYSSTCSNNFGSIAAFELKPNDPSITGIESYPLAISGVGSPLTFSKEVGKQVKSRFNVYANGVKIGTTDSHPNIYYKSDGRLNVKLDGYSDRTIYLQKDGSYTGGGFSSSSETLYYNDSNCSGAAYVKVLSDGDSEWWDETKLDAHAVQNNGNYYSLSDEIYRASTKAGSYKYAHSTCSESATTFDTNAGYKVATPTSAPTIPVYSPPITIEGYTEPTPFNSLPVMN